MTPSFFKNLGPFSAESIFTTIDCKPLNIEKDYSFRVIDSPFIAIKKSYPSRILYSLLFSALITFLLICLIIKRNSSELIYEKK